MTDRPDADGDGLKTTFESALGDRDNDGIPNTGAPTTTATAPITPRKYEVPDPNQDGNPTDARDTHDDGTPDSLDPDDDGERVASRFEGDDPDEKRKPAAASDSDREGNASFRAADDGGDGNATSHEERNGNGNFDDDEVEDGVHGDLDTDDHGVLAELEAPDSDADGDATHPHDGYHDASPNDLDACDDGDGVPSTVEGSADRHGHGAPDRRDPDDDGDGLTSRWVDRGGVGVLG